MQDPAAVVGADSEDDEPRIAAGTPSTVPLAQRPGPDAPDRAPGDTSASSAEPPAPEPDDQRQPRHRWPYWAGWPWTLLLERHRERVARQAAAQARLEAWTETARTPLMRPLRLVIAAARGGVGKTTTTLGLGEELARLRADRIAVLDGQPLGGTAGLRVAAQPGLGLAALLTELDEVAADDSYTAWARYATLEHTSRVTVFGRPTPGEGDELTIDSYGPLAAGLTRQWPILVVDTGAPEGRSALQKAIVEQADVLVVVSSPGAATADATAGWLAEVSVPTDRRIGAVVPLTGGDQSHVDELLRATCADVVRVPFDPTLAGDAPIPMLAASQQETRDAFTALAGMVMWANRPHQEVSR